MSIYTTTNNTYVIKDIIYMLQSRKKEPTLKLKQNTNNMRESNLH